MDRIELIRRLVAGEGHPSMTHAERVEILQFLTGERVPQNRAFYIHAVSECLAPVRAGNPGSCKCRIVDTHVAFLVLHKEAPDSQVVVGEIMAPYRQDQNVW